MENSSVFFMLIQRDFHCIILLSVESPEKSSVAVSTCCVVGNGLVSVSLDLVVDGLLLAGMGSSVEVVSAGGGAGVL